MGEKLLDGVFSITNEDGTETVVGRASSSILEIGPRLLKRGGINRTRKRLWKKLHNQKFKRIMKPKILVITGVIENVNFDIKYSDLF